MSVFLTPEQIAENERLNKLAREKWEADAAAQKAAKDKEREERNEAERKAKEAELKTSLRTLFLQANEGATDADFERLYPSIRDEHYKRETEREDARQYEQARRNYQL